MKNKRGDTSPHKSERNSSERAPGYKGTSRSAKPDFPKRGRASAGAGKPGGEKSEYQKKDRPSSGTRDFGRSDSADFSKKDRPTRDFGRGDKPAYPRRERPASGSRDSAREDRPAYPRGERPASESRDSARGDRPAYPRRERPASGSRDSARGDRPASASRDSSRGERPASGSRGERPASGSRGASRGERPASGSRGASRGERPASGSRGASRGERPAHSRGDRPASGSRDSSRGDRPAYPRGDRPASGSSDSARGDRPARATRNFGGTDKPAFEKRERPESRSRESERSDNTEYRKDERPAEGSRGSGRNDKPEFEKRERPAAGAKSFGKRYKKETPKPERAPRERSESDYNPDRRKETLRSDAPVRLNKYIAHAGICSRREADTLIQTGAISVNGILVTELGTKVGPDDIVRYGDQRLVNEKKVYILLNKPKDYITTSEDPQGRKTVLDLVYKACRERVYPVGRLDRNTTGLLLFTNDGEMAKKLTHPKHGVTKIYHVHLDKALTKAHLTEIANGVDLDDVKIKPDAISYIEGNENKKEVGIEIHSGQNRVVRRIFEQFGYDVEKLDRVAFAGLTKKDLPRGKWRFLSEKEVNYLKMRK